MKFPKSVQKTIWYGDVKDEKRPEAVITAVLNRGDVDDIRWVMDNYDKDLIKSTVENPDKGMWDRKSLNLWQKYFDIDLPHEVIESAIIDPKKF